MKIPRLMSTQHPDNAKIPFFAKNPVLGGEDEIEEAFYAFSELGIDEQLWDFEGKEVDNYVIKKLFSKYPTYFKKSILGKDKFITFRIPNPEVEKDDGKILLETLNSIPRNFDVGTAFGNKDIPPVFEVMIPMCFSEKPLIRLSQYYQNFIVKNQEKTIYNNDITVAQWIGKFKPDKIRVTPLFETRETIANSSVYVEKYIEAEKIKDLQRVWFARSDPALNYGSVAAVMVGKIGLLGLWDLQEKKSVDILPIMGCGSAPFRGNFKPTNVKAMLDAYPNIQTFTIQSAFKYDYGVRQVIDAVEEVKDTKRKAPIPLDIAQANKLIDRMEKDYKESVQLLAKTINMASHFVPRRRLRKLHIDLFGYARKSAGVKLPRAITFTCALYSLGLPPEILGLSNITPQEIDSIREYYKSIDTDMADALQYFNKDTLSFFPKEIQKRVLKALELFEYEPDQEHNRLTSSIVKDLKDNNIQEVEDNVVKAARIRQFLG